MKALGKLLGVHSPVYTSLQKILGGGKFVGEDSLGNKYYRAKARKGYHRERRWVHYKDAPEASLVPPEWHGWLHHQSDVVPSEAETSYRRSWQKQHRPNMTGTTGAYRPPGHILAGDKRDKATGDYEAWTPDAD